MRECRHSSRVSVVEPNLDVTPRIPANRRPLHYDKSRSFKMLDKLCGDNPRPDLGGVMLPLAAIEARCERWSVGALASEVDKAAVFPDGAPSPR